MHGPVEARQEEVARGYLQRAEEVDRKPGTSEGAEGPMTKGVKPCGSRVLVPVFGVFSYDLFFTAAGHGSTGSRCANRGVRFRESRSRRLPP